MIAAQGDPFLEALLSGFPEGDLVTIEHRGHIPVLGPPIRRTPQRGSAELEILNAIDITGGESFRKFFANVFRNGETAPQATAEPPSAGEENPFRDAIEALAGQAQVPAAVNPAAEAEAPPAKAEEAAPANAAESPAPAAPQQIPAGGGVTTNRPSVMLKVGSDGALHTTPVSHPGRGIFESAEFGVAEFAVEPFPNPADFPMAVAVGDFNGDGLADYCLHFAQQATLRFFFGAADGSYAEGANVRIGKGPRSLAAGDFDRDGRADVAVSAIGIGTLTVLNARPEGGYRFKVFWPGVYRDYITAFDTSGSGGADLIGVSFSDTAEVLVDFSQPDGVLSDRKLDCTASFHSEIATVMGRRARLSAVGLGSALSVNVDDSNGQLANVLNLSAGVDLYVVVGDIQSDGSLVVGLARPRNGK